MYRPDLGNALLSRPSCKPKSLRSSQGVTGLVDQCVECSWRVVPTVIVFRQRRVWEVTENMPRVGEVEKPEGSVWGGGL